MRAMNLHIQSLRGLACVLLVLYHVVGSDQSQGLQVADGLVRWFNDGLAYLRMPLFTVLSGLVYGLRPFVQGGDSRAFLFGKVRRLLAPMLVVGTIFAILQAITPGTHGATQDWRLLHIEPVAHFWFLESLFWVFMLIWLLERQAYLSRPRDYGLVLSAAVVLYLNVRGPRTFSIEGAIYLFPYFLAGLAVTRFGVWRQLSKPLLLSILFLLALLAVISMGIPQPNLDRRTLWVLLAGLSLCGLCLGIRLDWPWLVRIGISSYAIYLFHVFFTATSRIALQKIGIEAFPLQLVAGLLFGLLGPMGLERFVSQFRWPALLLLGKSLRKGR